MATLKSESAKRLTLADISRTEQTMWGVSGPLVGDGHELSPEDNRVPGDPDQPLYRLWPTWADFFTFYESVRAEYLDPRRALEHPAVEVLFGAWRRGEDVDAVVESIEAERWARDPRWRLRDD